MLLILNSMFQTSVSVPGPSLACAPADKSLNLFRKLSIRLSSLLGPSSHGPATCLQNSLQGANLFLKFRCASSVRSSDNRSYFTWLKFRSTLLRETSFLIQRLRPMTESSVTRWVLMTIPGFSLPRFKILPIVKYLYVLYTAPPNTSFRFFVYLSEF